MTTLHEAAQQALAHVQEFKRRWMAVPPFGNKVNKATREGVTFAHTPVFQIEEALRSALEQPVQEPGPCQTCQSLARAVMMDQTGYDMPPRREWRGLTDAERASVQFESFKRGLSPLEFMELHEAKLKEKNHE